jgi:hypothetical protein
VQVDMHVRNLVVGSHCEGTTCPKQSSRNQPRDCFGAARLAMTDLSWYRPVTRV